MANPFEKRVTEYLRDDEAFLSVVTPTPLATFFQKYAKEGRLYDRLAMVIGTPGSGKTTIARLFQFTTLTTLLGNRDMTNYRPLIGTLTACDAIDNYRPKLIGARLPLEAEYRDIWEFDYPDDLKTGLMIKLLQARAMLAWLRNVQESGVPLDQIEIIPRVDASAALSAIGGTAGPNLFDRARKVELAIYQVTAALLPPEIKDIDRDVRASYRPFDVIETFRIDGRYYHPLIIFDDAHSLHPDQFKALRRWLSQRELKVSRWVLTRFDALTPGDVLLEPDTSSDSSTLKPSRETIVIRMQSSSNDRVKQRRAFRTMAKDMARRYLSQMEVFNRRHLHSLSDLLQTTAVHLSPGKRGQLREHVNRLQRRYGISPNRRRTLEQEVNDYIGDNGEDMRLGILSVLFERYAKRIQRSLFEDDVDDPEPSRRLTADAGVADGARIQLLHNFGVPYFFGIDTLCDASSENAEQFLQLAARLVEQSETQLIRGKNAALTSGVQNSLLRRRAKQMMDEWNFPQCRLVRRLADGIACECVVKSREGNASLNGGATAFGIPQDDFNYIPNVFKNLAQVLKYGVAYNAFVLVPNHSTKNRLWCLIELGGVLRLHYGLTLKRGGFLERSTRDLMRLLGDS